MPDDDRGTIEIEEPSLTEKFTMVPNYILRHKEISAGAKLTYAMLLMFAWYENKCFPGQVRLAAEIGISPRSVWNHLQELRQKGLLRIQRRGLGKTNVYTLTAWIGPTFATPANQHSQPDPNTDSQQVRGKETQLKKTKKEEVRAPVVAPSRFTDGKYGRLVQH